MRNKLYKSKKPSKNLIITITSLWALGQVILIFFFTDVLKNHLLSFDYFILDLLILTSGFFVYKLNYNYYKKTKSAYAHVRRY
ncbi:hypothetical protein AXE80_02355 [Wenyingzhuangia fucanilytica]|uniref:Uncharacterized protein n=1 Tax=Wenyingzhuangia fucanilytica TaxID=1790137 RepID=A0A1B1Y346_9FLAO|nr:hypothetical protein [Wenyingzhuangia fucanilytica]ANW95194.1 hypothetical protein AXE80_02355 [Wenyingzhuangia fucanilytica]